MLKGSAEKIPGGCSNPRSLKQGRKAQSCHTLRSGPSTETEYSWPFGIHSGWLMCIHHLKQAVHQVPW